MRWTLIVGVMFCSFGAMGASFEPTALSRILRPSARMQSFAELMTNHVSATPTVRPNLPNAPTPSMLREAGVWLIDPSAFDAGVLDAFGTVERGGVKLYEVFAYEDRSTRERRLCGAEGKPIWVEAAPAGYDPALEARVRWPWLTSLAADDPVRCRYEAACDPARVVSRYLLLPEKQLDEYAEGVATAWADLALLRDSPQRASIDPDAFFVTGIVRTNASSVTLAMQFPPGFTNRVDIFGIGSITNFPWHLLETTPPATSRIAEVSLAWSGIAGFFRAGDADTDTDGDGLPDARETLLYGTEPDEADTDGDRLPDGWEIAYGLDPFAEDSLADPDNDRVPTLYEYYHGANPTNADNPVDADLVNCAWDESFTHSNAEAFVRLEQSVAYHISLTNCLVPRVLDWFPPDTQSDLIVTNANLAMGGHLRSGSPAIDAGFAAAPRLDFEGQARDSAPDIGADEYAGFAGGDSDGDGLGDAAEVEVYGTNPKDYDGMSDFWEARHGLSWTNAADACQNPDGDGLVNLHEYWCQTDPSAADGAQYALSAAALAIDSRIAERNPTNALPLFENYLANGANGVFIRNTNCWAADLDLTCCSPWNSYLGNRIDNGDREIATKAARLFSWFAVGSTGASGNRGCAVWSSACPANLRLLVRLVQGVSAAGRAGWDEATPITPRRAGAPRSDRAARAC